MTASGQLFELFAALPLEIRDLIWAFAHQEPLIHYIESKHEYHDDGTDCWVRRTSLSSHYHLNIACRESWEVGQRIRPSTRPINPDFDAIYFHLPHANRTQETMLHQSLGSYLVKSIAICDTAHSCWWDRDTGEFLSQFPQLTELLVVKPGREDFTMDDESHWSREFYTSGYRVSLGAREPLSTGERGRWPGLGNWQASMLSDRGRAIGIWEVKSQLTMVRTKKLQEGLDIARSTLKK